MPLRVTIDLIPHGDERQRQTLEQITITQEMAYDTDPDGYRGYQIVFDDGDRMQFVTHRRGDGAARLAELALQLIDESRREEKAMGR